VAVLGDSSPFILPADDVAGDVLEEDERDAAFVADLDELRRLQGAAGKEDPVIAEDPHRITVDIGQPQTRVGP